MNKKLLASLMAGVMLVSSGVSLGAAKPNQGGVSGFIKENKSFILGGLSLAGLAGGIAYAVHRYNTPEVVEIEFPSLLKLLDTTVANISKGKTVKITSVDGCVLYNVVAHIFSLVPNASNIKHRDTKMIIKDADKFDLESKYDIVIRKVRKGIDRFELECIVDKSEGSKSDSKKEESSPNDNNESSSEKESNPKDNDEPSSKEESSLNNNSSTDSTSTDEVNGYNVKEMKYNRNAIIVDMNDGNGERKLSLDEICGILKQSSLVDTQIEIKNFPEDLVVMISQEIAKQLDYSLKVYYMPNKVIASKNLKIIVQRDQGTGEISNICASYGCN